MSMLLDSVPTVSIALVVRLRNSACTGWRNIRGGLIGVLVAFAFAPGCATVDTKVDSQRVAQFVDSAVNESFAMAPFSNAAVQSEVTRQLADGLTLAGATRIALLNNPRIHAGLHRLGVGRAEVVQAGLFRNPTISLMLRWPDGGGLTNLEMNIAQNLADLWQIPARRRAAEREQERVVLEVAREAVNVVLDVRAAFYRASRAAREQSLAEENLEIARQLLEIALARRAAGAGSELDINLSRAQQLEAELRVREAALETIERRSALARLLGLELPPGQLVIRDEAQEMRLEALTAERVISAAHAHRLDLRAARAVCAAAAARVEYEKTRFLREIEVGISAERMERPRRRDRNWLYETAWASAEEGMLAAPSLMPRERRTTDWVIGPTLTFELPLFDWNDAQVARATHEHRQAEAMFEAMRRDLVQDAWVAFARAQTAWSNARFYEEELLPLEQDSLILARESYQAGRSNLLAVLDAQRTLLASRLGHVRAVEAAMLATVELERVAGCPLQQLIEIPTPETESPPASQPSTEPAGPQIFEES